MQKPLQVSAPRRVLAISSQVVRGHVGLSAMVPALQTFGHEVWPLPTVLLSNHPGHGRVAGQRIAVAQLDAMLDVLDGHGWLGALDAVVTGYLPSAEHVAFAARTIERIRRRRQVVRVVVDPVLGDAPKGLYIDAAAAAAIRDDLVPLADLVTPNRFELGWLSGRPLPSRDAMLRAARDLGVEDVIVTSAERMAGGWRDGAGQVEGATAADGLVTLLVARSSACAVSCLWREGVPNGTGDLLAGLLVGHLLNGAEVREALARAVHGVDLAVAASAGLDELCLAVLPHAVAAAPWSLQAVTGPVS